MIAIRPIFTVDLFPILEAKLIELLKTLRYDDWARPTLAKKWSVKDVAAHLLDGNIKRLSMQRDGYFGLPSPDMSSYESLIGFINRNNTEWVQAARRMSPLVLIELIEITSTQVCAFFKGSDPLAPAMWGVAWAGEEQSHNWFDIAREYTERWHHQQQIRVAVDRPGISGRDLYFPVLDTFMRGLPHAFRDAAAAEGKLVQVEIRGEAGGSWFLQKADSVWKLVEQGERPDALVGIDQELAWRLFTKAVDPQLAAQQVAITGDSYLAMHVLSLVAVLA
jgi:uncharacterized protein (TIGR03083 family)